jgi:hypothetical protein
MARRRSERVQPEWDRAKLLALLVAASCVALLLVTGLVLAVIYAVSPARSSHSGSPQQRPGSIADRSAATTPTQTDVTDPHRAEDELAASPMPSLDPELAKPGPISTRDPGALTIPPSTASGPAGAPSGFPHTASGALAQLAAIDQTALQSGSLAGARAVITAWAAPGGPTPDSWSGVALLAQLLDAAGLSGGGSPQFAVALTPMMGLIKGTVGPDFVIPCVDFELDVTLTSTARAAVADCQRMVWTGTRWVIGPGPESAGAPSAWPDTDAAIDVGYQDLRHE